MVFHSDLVGFNGDLMRILLHDTDLMVIEWDFLTKNGDFHGIYHVEFSTLLWKITVAR